VAPTSRHEDPAMNRTAPDCPELEEALRTEPFAFGFFQAVRLLGRLLPDRQPVGQFSNPGSEIVRFGAGADFGFPPSEIAGLEWPEGAQPRMRVNFMGLTGPQGVLPLYYTAFVRERLHAHDSAMRDFFDIFNHRLISLFYQAWEKSHLCIGYGRSTDDRLSSLLLDLLGLGTPGLTDRQAVPDGALLFRCGLLAAHSRSAAALRALLMDHFDVPVEIEQFMGRWHAIDESTQCRFTGTASYSEQLGEGAVVGDEIWDQQSGVRIRLGPLTLDQYRKFLPDGSAYEPLRSLVRFFAGNELDFEVQLVLKKEERPPCELGGDGPTAPRLGWSTWAGTAPLPHDPDASILRI
jgi:type VI secretion system protein ImpH